MGRQPSIPFSVVSDCLKPPQIDPLGFFCAVELRLHIQNNASTILEQLANQRPTASNIVLVRNGKDDRIGGP